MADLTSLIVRTVTVFVAKEYCHSETVFKSTIAAAVQKAQQVKSALVNHGILVQTIRLSLPSPAVFGSQRAALEAAHILDKAEVDHSSLGLILPEDADFVSSEFYTNVIRETESVSLVASLTSPKADVIDLQAVSAAAAAVSAISKLDEHGFSNFRFAALANVLPNGPFFPASYASRDQMFSDDNAQQFQVALGVQGATLLNHVVSQRKGDVRGIYDAFTVAIENCAKLLVKVCASVASVAIDFSTAPVPGMEHSIGEVLAKCASVTRFPSVGGLSAAASLAFAIDRAQFPRTGFCGIMLPVCEDDVLAASTPSLSELLMCSSVCGTGLDTVPVPGDISVDTIKRIMLDVAALSMRLSRKQLTVRLMPVPGKVAGQCFGFDSPYMCNTCICEVLDDSVSGPVEISSPLKIGAIKLNRI